MQTNSALRYSQSGLVSFVVTMILMIVITLIMVGFTQLVIRNREDALDKQLSTQAFYAAETGINDTLKVLRALYADPVNAADPFYAPPKKTTCADAPPYQLPVAAKQINGDNSVSYTCVLVTPNSEWIQTSAGTNSSKVLLIEPVDDNGVPTDLRDLTFKWRKSTAGSFSDCPTSHTTYPANLGTCPYGLLRVDLYRHTGATTSEAMLDTMKTFFLMPVSSGYLYLTADGTDKSYRGSAGCDESECSSHVVINGPEPPVGTTNKYYMRISSIYHDIDSVVIEGRQWVPSYGAFNFSFKGQTLIDVTGKANDVIRRVQAQVSKEQFSTNFTPNAAIHSGGDFCKRFVVFNGYTEDKCI